MKKLPLKNLSFRYLEKSFGEWLDILGYSPATVYGIPLYVREFLVYLECQGIEAINQLDSNHIKEYYNYLSSRGNQRRSGGLNSNYLNNHIQALRKFVEYLRKSGRLVLADLPLKNEKPQEKEPTWLTQEEIKDLFSVIENPYTYQRNISEVYTQTMKSRDRATLSVFYSCGLRRTEAVSLILSDINWDRNLLHVRKGKRYKERMIPMSKQTKAYLEEWVFEYRHNWKNKKTGEELFITRKGSKASDQTLLLRLKILQQLSQNPALKEKEIGLHTLRHSIATHLLQNGMKIEAISRFLGHSSLESTQIYTHLSPVSDGKHY